MGTNAYEYGYDPIGNRVFSAVNALTNAYTANALNQYTAISGGWAVSPTYDSDGNTTWDGRFSHSWDSENRLLKSIPGGTVTNGSVMVENRYDYLHRRVSKAVRRLTGRGPGYPLDPSQAGTWALVEARAFVYDGWNLIRETVSDTNGVTGVTEYFWGPDLSGTLQGAGGVGGLLAVSMNGSFYFPCYDNNGNVIAYAGENGALRAEYVYDVFGNTVSQSGDMADAFSYRFSTKYWDEGTGLYYYGYRFYSPDLGRWMSRDPLGDIASLLSAIDQANTIENKRHLIDESFGPLYLFAKNNSVCFVDADGRMSLVSWIGIYEALVHSFAFKYGRETYPGADAHSKCIRHCNTSCIITKWNLMVPVTAITGSMFELLEWYVRGRQNETGLHDIYNNLRGYGAAWHVFSSCSGPCEKKCECEPRH